MCQDVLLAFIPSHSQTRKKKISIIQIYRISDLEF